MTLRRQVVWTLDRHHVAIAFDELAGRRLDADDPLLDLRRAIYADRETAMAATEQYLRAAAERDPMAIAPVPSWGPGFCDFDMEAQHGRITWSWRLHRQVITRTDAGVTVSSTFDYRQLAPRRVPTSVDLDGERHACGWATQHVPLHDDWRPLTGIREPGDCGAIDPSDPERRVILPRTIAPARQVLRWVSCPPEPVSRRLPG